MTMGAKAKRHCRILLSSNSEVTKNCRAKEVLGVDELEARMDKITDRVARYKTNAERAHTDDEAQRLSN